MKPTRARVSTRALLLSGFLVALLLAGVVSIYASSSPDGLSRVAQDHGFSHTAREHDRGPLAGYDVPGLGSPALSRGAAGVAGSLVVLVLAGGLALAVRRRAGRGEPDESS